MAFRNHRKCFLTAVSRADKAPSIMMPLPSEPLLCQGLGGTVHSTVQNPIPGPEGSSLSESRPQIMPQGTCRVGNRLSKDLKSRRGEKMFCMGASHQASPGCPLLPPVELLHAHRDHERSHVIPGDSYPLQSHTLPAHCSPLDSCPSFFGLCKLPKK